ncbi:Eco57I restriction-modification methylase domain-containing protein [Kitasatospora sp. NPDC058032]|uniref:Eco57I restriction-modification methylase domain-containing protein n=1 Tax=Kitasatospora sp. NPDC058032 TaxID=3346307 RepID=UPI0036D8497E
MTYDSLVNRGEYLSAFYLDDVLPGKIKSGLLKEWTERERQKLHTPRQGLRDLSDKLLAARGQLVDGAERYNGCDDQTAVAALAEAARILKAAPEDATPTVTLWTPAHFGLDPEGEWRGALHQWHDQLMLALGITPAPQFRTMQSAAGRHAIPLAHAEDGLVVITGGFATDVDAALDPSGANRLSAPVRVATGEQVTTVTALARWLFQAENAPRYALLLFGSVVVLADCNVFGQGRYLAVSLDIALPRKKAKGATAGEIDIIATLFGAPSLRPGTDGAEDEIAKLIAASNEHAVGVSADLRNGLQESVQLIANEVLTLARAKGVEPADLAEWLPHVLKEPGDLPRLLTTEALRYLYRILFLLYAEARPELKILPMDSEEYVSGYSLARLRDLVVAEQLIDPHSRERYHFHESLELLFEKVYTGHPVADTARDRGAVSEPAADELLPDDGQPGVRIEALRSRLFDPASIKLIGRVLKAPAHAGSEERRGPDRLDLRPRNKTLHKVLRLLTIAKPQGASRRAGFISYAKLSINQLGAVYEGLMSYTGFIAEKPLYEVAPSGDPKDGFWLITESQAKSGRYPDPENGVGSVFVKDKDPRTHELVSRVHPVGSYVYRLAGRDRQTSASYYTPESLTKATVEQALRFRLHPEGDPDPANSTVTAAEVLRWRVCEPALGSGAFLNEAVNQLADTYLRLAQKERGQDIPAEDYPAELQKVKAYIALHNAYGVDLNRTAVELAEISLWLNTVHPGMKAPWYGLHLHRGNSLIGAARRAYSGQGLSAGGWLKTKDPQRPTAYPLAGGPIPGRAVHQFLLPAMGWGSVTDESEADRLEPEAVRALKAWRKGIRKGPKGEAAKKTAGRKKAATASAGGSATVLAAASGSGHQQVTVRIGVHRQGTFDLGQEMWEQDTLLSGAGPGADVATSLAAPEFGRAKRGTAAIKAAAKADQRAVAPYVQPQTGRLQALARRVEYLWELVVKRLELSEQEIARSIDVWGASEEMLAERSLLGGRAVDRDAVREALHSVEGPYWRLKQVMDAWCALWFWPLDKVGELDGTDELYVGPEGEDLTLRKKGQSGRKVALKNLDDWIEFAEAVVGAADVDRDGGTFFDVVEARTLAELDDFEEQLNATMVDATVWARANDLGERFPWSGTASRIAEQHGFFHWELDFAHIFSDGGFDLQVGNPPWVKPEWDQDGALAEFEPWFKLEEKYTTEAHKERKNEVLALPAARAAFLGELADHAAVWEFLSSADMYPELVGTQPDLYRAFMLLSWRCVGERGISGLLHPATHLTGTKDGKLRRATYGHLRLHADFVNAKHLFAPPVGHTMHFSLNIYGVEREIRFQHVNWLFHPLVLGKSISHDGAGDVPGIKHNGTWDLRPHRARITIVDRAILADWRDLAGEEKSLPLEEVKLLFPITAAEQDAIAALARWPHRLGAMKPLITRGFHEKDDRAAGHFSWDSGPAGSLGQVILQAPFFGVATPFAKQPVNGATTAQQVESWDSVSLAQDAIPRTNYRPTQDSAKYAAGLRQTSWLDGELLEKMRDDKAVLEVAGNIADESSAEGVDRESVIEQVLMDWATRSYSKFWRVIWREMIPSDTERSLFASLIPVGVAHVHTARSSALPTKAETVLVAGFFAALPLDYLLRAANRRMDVTDARSMPAPSKGHPLASALLLRTLRLNCQTNAYAPLWAELYDEAWRQDTWASDWPGLPPLAMGVTPTWTAVTPLRAERSRRSALVELDALVAVWLGITADQLIAMYDARFPVMQQYEANMWFDAAGRRITKAHQVHGYGQPKDAWKQLISHEDYPREATLPAAPTHPAPLPTENWEYCAPLRRADREAEMRAAHAEFTRRLRAAGWEPGMSQAPGTVGSDDTSTDTAPQEGTPAS